MVLHGAASGHTHSCEHADRRVAAKRNAREELCDTKVHTGDVNFFFWFWFWMCVASEFREI